MKSKPDAAYAVGAHLVQDIVDYIEENLFETLTPAAVARQFYLSVSAVNNLFTMVCDTGIMEYIRNRRLSLAGQALLESKVRIIDLALQVGYETPEAFSKAFTRFHGVPPSVVRRVTPPLRQYHPIRVRIEIAGGWENGTLPSNRKAAGQEMWQGSWYHGPHKEEGGTPMESDKTTCHISVRDMEYQKDWGILLSLARRLDDDGIRFKVDGKTMIFAHGLEFQLEKICLTFLWNEEQRVLDFFGRSGQARELHPGKAPSFKYCDADCAGMKVRCMFFGRCEGDDTEEFLFRNTDCVDVDGQLLRVQTLEFYYKNGDREDEYYTRVEEFLKQQKPSL